MGDADGKRWALEDSSVARAGAEALARMLDVEGAGGWSARDGAGALRQQLKGPVPTGGARGSLAEVLMGGTREELEVVKAWAREVRGEAGNPLGESGATVIYYAAIAAARVRFKAAITGLTEEEMRAGFGWGRGVAGAEELNGLFEEAERKLATNEH